MSFFRLELELFLHMWLVHALQIEICRKMTSYDVQIHTEDVVRPVTCVQFCLPACLSHCYVSFDFLSFEHEEAIQYGIYALFLHIHTVIAYYFGCQKKKRMKEFLCLVVALSIYSWILDSILLFSSLRLERAKSHLFIDYENKSEGNWSTADENCKKFNANVMKVSVMWCFFYDFISYMTFFSALSMHERKVGVYDTQYMKCSQLNFYNIFNNMWEAIWKFFRIIFSLSIVKKFSLQIAIIDIL